MDALVADARADGVGDAPANDARPSPWPNDPYPAGSGVAERYATLRALLAGDLDPDTIVHDAQGLRRCAAWAAPASPPGRSGSWSARASRRDVKYVICNADESEPGTFKDRQILATQPHLVLEGLLLGMAVVGAEQGWVFIRHEYGPEEHVLRAELDALRAAGVVGPDACGSGRRLDVEVFVSPGGYILGEETALLECMEGHRGEPRNKPPFPGNYGLHGRPTLINSVETFADVPVIVQRGAQWWADQGAGESVGWKFFAVSGHVERPDVYCVPMGTTVRELIDLAGGVTGGAGGRGGAAGRGVVELHRTRQAGHAAGLRRRRRGRHHARLRRRWSCWPRAPTCWPRRRTCCGSSATSRAASACRAGSAPPRRTTILRDVVDRLRARRRPAGADPAAGGGHAQDLHLRARAGRAGTGA